MIPAVTGYGDALVTPHVLATSAGLEALSEGGNAVDAMIAANAVLGVVAPETCGIGGDLFALVWDAREPRPDCLNASGPAGEGADPAELTGAGHGAIPRFHPLTVTVPGCVAGWAALNERYGKLALDRLLGPAVRLAERGFPASSELVASLEAGAGTLTTQAAAADLYPGGAPPRRERRIVRPSLAQTLRAIGDSGAAGFYAGKPAVAISEAVGGRISLDDLASYRPEWVEPLSMEVFGLTGWTTPPNSQGYLTLATLAVFEATRPPADPDDPDWLHLLVEAYRAVAWARDDVLSDPRTLPDRFWRYTDRDWLTTVARQIHRDNAGSWPPGRESPGGTAYLCAIDADGMAVSFIQSNYMGIGSGIGAGDSGFFLHNRGAGFTLRAGHPNRLEPGRRPLHTLSPTMWAREGRLAAVLGTRGGNQQPQLVSQMAARLFQIAEPPAGAQSAPRWTMADFGPGSGSRVIVESGWPDRVVDGLRGRGHTVERLDGPQRGWGPVSAITIDEEGLRTAVADPRSETAVAAVR